MEESMTYKEFYDNMESGDMFVLYDFEGRYEDVIIFREYSVIMSGKCLEAVLYSMYPIYDTREGGYRYTATYRIDATIQGESLVKI